MVNQNDSSVTLQFLGKQLLAMRAELREQRSLVQDIAEALRSQESDLHKISVLLSHHVKRSLRFERQVQEQRDELELMIKSETRTELCPPEVTEQSAAESGPKS